MTYADTDFFLALIKEKDWLQSRARKLLQHYKGELWTSLIAVTELLLLAARLELDPERMLVAASQIAELRNVDLQIVLLAAHFMKQNKLGTFDALHASFCLHGKDKILSSDKVFEQVGLQRIPLEI